ncbi:MAG: SH2 domain-containing protein [Simkaniaceae bacterium]|nr:SH2 domain-containing protein [Candidatus Sacchlamyda saccharinae]
MKIVILDKKVHRNLQLFRHLIHRNAEKMHRFFRRAQKTYQAYVNCKTGEMRFEEKKKLSDDWKPILIQLRPSEEGGAFEVETPDAKEVFPCEDFSKEAYALFTKTMHILNQIAYDPKHRKNPFFILRQVAHVDFVFSEDEEGRRNFVHEAWHNVDRSEAEFLLKRAKPGTYLFRKDEFAKNLEDRFNEEVTDPITCITLCFRDFDDKICEKTLVFRDEKWQFYNDDIALKQESFDTVKELLATMQDRLSDPLFVD